MTKRTAALVLLVCVSSHRTTGFYIPPCTAEKFWQKVQISCSSSKNRDDDSSFLEAVSVFDSVFSREACRELDIILAAERGGDASLVFDRRDSFLTPMERAIDSFLHHVHDPNHVVEYWSRQEFLNMDVHADIDERALQENHLIQCPEWGHVLYLNVNKDIRGPTCVFSQHKGWSNEEEKRPTSMVIVPALQGRVLRFPGSAMHAVPKPCHRWLLDESEQELLTEEEEMYDDEGNESNERSVLLFNTWSDQGAQGILLDATTGILPDGIEIEVDDSAGGLDYEQQQRAARLVEWEENYGVDCKDVLCQPLIHWKQQSIVGYSSSEGATKALLRLPLMGTQKRRLYATKYASVIGPPSIGLALEEESQSSILRLQEMDE